MSVTPVRNDRDQLVLQPNVATLTCGYFFVTIFGGSAVVYSVGVASAAIRNNFLWWETALVVGMPLLFAAVLVSWVWDNRKPFLFDRKQGFLFDGTRPILSLDAVQAVALRKDPGETADFFPIDLVLAKGKTFTPRRHWWAMDSDQEVALARAELIAEYLGVELRDAAGTVQQVTRT